MKIVLLALFLGPFGGYRFYKKNYKLALLYLCTAGVFGCGWLYDIYLSFREWFESKTNEENPTVERKKKIKYKAIIATVLSLFIVCSPLMVVSMGIELGFIEYEEPTTDWDETMSECITCGKKIKRKHLYGSLCGSCYKKVQDRLGK